MEQVKKTGPPIFRAASILFKMTLFILVGLAVCFSVGPVLSSTLTYLEIRNLHASSYVSEYDYRREKIAGIAVGIISIGLGITGIAAVATVPHSRKEIYYWLDGVIMCNLQILVSHNVRQSACFVSSSSTNSTPAHSVVAKLYLSSLGYMGGASGGVNNYTRHRFRS
jgi:hypothetical protein